MGNILSSFISETFMAKLEKNLASVVLTKFWRKHMYNICTIISKDEVENILIFLE